MLAADIRHSVRSLGQRPGFVLALMVTVALGIGSNASVLGFMNGLVGRRAPLLDDRLTAVSVFSRREDGGLGLLSYEQYVAVKAQTQIFDSLAAVRETRNTIGVGASSVVAAVATVTPEAPALFGLPPGDGIVVSEPFRDREFSGQGDIARQHVTLDGAVLPVAGVAPEPLEGLYIGRPVDVWVLGESSLRPDRDSRTLSVIGRLRDGVSMRDARETLDGLPLPGAATALVALPYTGLTPEMQEGIGRLGKLMPAVAGAVFLIACANVAIFLLSRAANRSHETSLRMALGATRGALARAVFVDSALIAAAGAAAGLLVAVWTADIVPALLFEADAADMKFVPGTAGVVRAAVVSAIITLGCGMVPLLEMRHDTPGAVLRREPRRPSQPLRRLRSVLVVFQMSVCCALVISAASLVDALDATLRTTAGERLGRPILVTVESERRFSRPDLGFDYFRRVEQTLRREPGITSAAWIGALPGRPASWSAVKVEPPGLATREVTATAGVFAASTLSRLILPPKAGRMFGGQDTAATCKVVIVDESIATTIFDNDAVGRAMDDAAGNRIEIVGVVRRRPSPEPASSDEPAVFYYERQGDVPFRPPAQVRFRVPEPHPSARGMLDVKIVSNDYFAALGVPLTAGKLFADDVPTDACRVGVVNEEAAQLYFGEKAVGGAVIEGGGRRTTIVGVVRDVRLRATERRAEPSLYLPMAQNFQPRMHMILGSADASADLQNTIRMRVLAVDGGRADAVDVISLEDRLRKTALAAERIASLLLGVASLNALAIGILGVFRVVADDVLVRRREIAVRSALGAQGWRLILMVVMQGARLAVAGGLFGVVGALLLVSWMRSVTGFDGSSIGWVWLTGPVVLAIGALVGSILPARRVLGVAPLTAMSAE